MDISSYNAFGGWTLMFRANTEKDKEFLLQIEEQIRKDEQKMSIKFINKIMGNNEKKHSRNGKVT